MRIAAVSHTSWAEHDGGVESFLRRTLPSLGAQGHDVVHVHGSHNVRPAVEVAEGAVRDGVRSVAVHRDDLYFEVHSRVWHPGVGDGLRVVLRDLRPDILHVHHWVNLTSDLVRIGVEEGIPVVVSLHDAWTTCPRGFRVDREGLACAKQLGASSCRSCVPVFEGQSDREVDESIELHRERMRNELALANRVLVADSSLADLVAGQLGAAGIAFESLPLTAGWRPAGRTFAPAGQPFRFGWWGVAAAHKGVGDLLEAFEIVWKQRGDHVHLDLLGPIVDRSIERRARDLVDAGAPVVLHGKFEARQISELEIDAAVQPSRAFETWSLALDEAMALAVPLIVSDVGAPARRLGGAGLLVPPNDPGALASAMLRLVDDPTLCADLVAARPLPAEDFDLAERLEAIYGDVIQEGPRRAGPDDLRARSDALRRSLLDKAPDTPPR